MLSLFCFSLLLAYLSSSIAGAAVQGSCHATDVLTVKSRIAHYVYFCNFYVSRPRVLSPLAGLNETRVYNACECIKNSAKAPANPNIHPEPVGEGFGPDGACYVSDITVVKKEFVNAIAFCKFYTAWSSEHDPKTPISSLTRSRTHNACRCLLQKSVLPSTSASKPTTRSTLESGATSTSTVNPDKKSTTTSRKITTTTGAAFSTYLSSRIDATFSTSTTTTTQITTTTTPSTSSTTSNPSALPSGIRVFTSTLQLAQPVRYIVSPNGTLLLTTRWGAWGDARQPTDFVLGPTHEVYFVAQYITAGESQPDTSITPSIIPGAANYDIDSNVAAAGNASLVNVFAVDYNKLLCRFSREHGGEWSGANPISSISQTIPVGAAVAAVQLPGSGTFAVFVVDSQGNLLVNYGEGSRTASWAGTAGIATGVPSLAALAATTNSSIPDQAVVYWIGADGLLRGLVWTKGATTLAPTTFTGTAVIPAGQDIYTTVSRGVTYIFTFDESFDLTVATIDSAGNMVGPTATKLLSGYGEFAAFDPNDPDDLPYVFYLDPGMRLVKGYLDEAGSWNSTVVVSTIP
ncbi:hypothetical protein K461DRAFT_272250 [Myriangium duriaei CBS 260.36]|uniref:Fucose-specific lectin n=1 Tax=Myriangium duriaei CBS 260.36 TaxID=1168546 RepID=A0A9P4IQ75_9PEZI|nr:hypothetical protein K461DRAFT_272250 [Myriangium duriaei CBS 260.36]